MKTVVIVMVIFLALSGGSCQFSIKSPDTTIGVTVNGPFAGEVVK